MERAVIGWPSYRKKATFSTAAGGSFVAGFPVANMGVLPISQVARSSTAAAADTKFQVTFTSSYPVRMLALIGHNASLGGTFRIKLYSDIGMTTLVKDTGDLEFWPRVYPVGTLEWGDPRFWSGKYSLDQIASYNACTPVWLDRLYQVRAIQVEITDTTNADGYVQIGVMEIATGWQFSLNPDVGAEYGFRARTRVQESIGGPKDFKRLTAPRVWQGTIAYLDRNEALAKGFDFLRDMDLEEPFVWMPRPPSADDARAQEHLLRTCWYARNTELGLMAFATGHDRDRFPVRFEEVV